MLLDDVRTGVHPELRSERIVWTFSPVRGEDVVPRWLLEQARPPLLRDGSGDPIKVDGSSFFRLTVFASGVDTSGDEFRLHYTGPKRFVGSKVVAEVAEAGDFENTMTWYIGMRRNSCAAVHTLRGPVRIVVDVEAPD